MDTLDLPLPPQQRSWTWEPQMTRHQCKNASDKLDRKNAMWNNYWGHSWDHLPHFMYHFPTVPIPENWLNRMYWDGSIPAQVKAWTNKKINPHSINYTEQGEKSTFDWQDSALQISLSWPTFAWIYTWYTQTQDEQHDQSTRGINCNEWLILQWEIFYITCFIDAIYQLP